MGSQSFDYFIFISNFVGNNPNGLAGTDKMIIECLFAMILCI